MTQQHSPEPEYGEPWTFRKDLDISIYDCGGNFVGLSCRDDSYTERVIACVNACQGISNEELEAGVVANKSIDWFKMPVPECLREIARFLNKVDSLTATDYDQDSEIQTDLRQWADYLEELRPIPISGE